MKVKFLEPVFFEGKKYEKGETYNVSPATAGVLGNSVKKLGKDADVEEENVSEEGVENEEENEPEAPKKGKKGKK